MQENLPISTCPSSQQGPEDTATVYSDFCEEQFGHDISEADLDEKALELKKLNWTPEEDKLLLKVTVQYKNDWKKITRRLVSLTKKSLSLPFLKKRFYSLTEGLTVKGVKFSHFEDLIVAKYYHLYSTDWVKISSHLTNRTPMMVRNRFYSYIKKKKLLSQLMREIQSLEEKGLDIEYGPLQDTSNLEMNCASQEIKIQTQIKVFDHLDFNQTFIELNSQRPDDELHVHIWES